VPENTAFLPRVSYAYRMAPTFRNRNYFLLSPG
jgi:hypothetical protein